MISNQAILGDPSVIKTMDFPGPGNSDMNPGFQEAVASM